MIADGICAETFGVVAVPESGWNGYKNYVTK